MIRKNGFTVFSTIGQTPKVFNVDNPVQAAFGGAARGREVAHRVSINPVGVELSCHTPSCAPLARGYYRFASYGGEWYNYTFFNIKSEIL
jgi:hypothetical protein